MNDDRRDEIKMCVQPANLLLIRKHLQRPPTFLLHILVGFFSVIPQPLNNKISLITMLQL